MVEPRHVEANGLRFAYLEEGEGPLVLLFHGFPDTAHTWDDVRPRIAAAGFRAVSPFMRGYFPTAIPTKDTDQETLGRDVLALIDAFGEKDAIVVGHDWGATAVYVAASLEPSRVKKLVTVAIPHPASIRATPRMAWGVRHFLAYKMPGAASRFAADDFAALATMYKRWSPAWSPSAEEFEAVRACFSHRESLDAAMGYYRALELRPPRVLRQPIRVPTVAFAGLDDAIVRPADYLTATPMFASEYVVEAMRGGHFLHREHPDEFAKRLLSHL